HYLHTPISPTPAPNNLPYTTLFRTMAVKQKAEEDAQAKIAADKRAAEEREAKAHADAIAEGQRRQEAEQARQEAETAKAEAVRIDRKSSPLNSSHQIISYAVSCLKK